MKFPALSWLIWCLLLFTEEVWSEYSCPSLFTSRNTTYLHLYLETLLCNETRRLLLYCLLSAAYCLLPSSNDSCSLRLCRVSRHLHHHPAHICSKLCPRCERSRLHLSQIHPALRIAFQCMRKAASREHYDAVAIPNLDRLKPVCPSKILLNRSNDSSIHLRS